MSYFVDAAGLIAMFLLNYYTLQKASLLYLKSLQDRRTAIKLTVIFLVIPIILGAVEDLGGHGAVDAENSGAAFAIVQALTIFFVQFIIVQKWFRSKEGLRISVKDAFLVLLLQVVLSILIMLVLAMIFMVLFNTFVGSFVRPSTL